MPTLPKLEHYREIVDRELERCFSPTLPAPRLAEAMRYSLKAGGKRIRPALAFAACEAAGGIPEDALPVACALEMIHTYSLIHDDLPAMDDDDLRRGRPTNHKVYGEAIAILAGDGLLTEAFTVLSSPEWKIPVERRIEIVRIVSDGAGANGMVAGQVLDLEHEGKPTEERTLEQIHKHKTGKLLTAAVLAGGKAGGAEGKVFEALRTYGEKIGLAFQIADDILDLTATTEELGKDSKSDLKKGKATYPAILGMEESKKRAKILLDEAVHAVGRFGPRGETLVSLARFIVERRA
jgi:geranylgeranyl diphosphate synthase, type II